MRLLKDCRQPIKTSVGTQRDAGEKLKRSWSKKDGLIFRQSEQKERLNVVVSGSFLRVTVEQTKTTLKKDMMRRHSETDRWREGELRKGQKTEEETEKNKREHKVRRMRRKRTQHNAGNLEMKPDFNKRGSCQKFINWKNTAQAKCIQTTRPYNSSCC